MIALVELPYSWTDRFQKMPREVWDVVAAQLKEVFPAAVAHLDSVKDKEEPEEGWKDGDLRRSIYVPSEHVIDLVTDGVALSVLGIPFTVKRFKGAYRVSGTEQHVPGTTVNHIVQVAIPDLALLSIKTVTVLEDVCTNVLQGMLDKGWRILAICPPHAQRRPDYILGHTAVNADG